MKRLFFLVLIVFLLVFPGVAAASIGVNIDGEIFEFDPAPLLLEGRTLVPMRALFEALGAKVDYVKDTQTAVGSRGDIVVRIPIGSNKPTVNGVEQSIDVAAQLIEGRTFIPLRFVVEALGDKVWWDEATRTVLVKRVKVHKIDPLVSPSWLEQNLGLVKLVILDLRSESEYAEGHIAGTLNIPAASFWTMRDNLAMNLPEESAIFELIGSAGITADSLVVLVGTVAEPPAPPYPSAQVTRVADTLIYAGVKNVAVLDGGYPAWVAQGKAVTAEAAEVPAVAYRGELQRGMFVSRAYVERQIGKAIIIDTRDADVYAGEVIEPFAAKPGHIATARSLPTPLIWNADGTYKDVAVLREMAAAVAGENKNKEIIIYCGVGGYASSWWYVLTQMLGYYNVKIYDGSAQEWVLYNDMVMD